METIVLAGGCFWCTEAVFQSLKGVISVIPGYTGGDKPNPTYRDVCSGLTGHAEGIQVEFNPSQVSLRDILVVFFATHDPTTLNRQGADVGTQYRSAIFYTTPSQRQLIEEFIQELNRSAVQGAPIVTEVKELDHFWPAEEEHQDYYKRNLGSMYCAVVINPKLQKVQQEFAELIK